VLFRSFESRGGPACADGPHPLGEPSLRHTRLFLPVAAVLALLGAALALAPLGLDAGWLLYAQDDPALLAERVVDKEFSAPVAAREIEAALDAGDTDLADSFVELARARGIAIDPALTARLDAANSAAAQASRHVEHFARGLVIGEPDDVVGLAGTALGDLFVFGDIRDAVREGVRSARGEKADELVLGLACVGIAVTAGTYASVGLGTPARVGLSLAKAARKTGRMGARLAAFLGRSLREVVDMAALRRAMAGASLAEPAVAVRAAREAVKTEKAARLIDLAGDVGRVQRSAGTRAALEGLQIAEGPRDMSRLARLAEANGGKTRAILKLAGRAAIVLTTAVMNLVGWAFSALIALWTLCSAVKSTSERVTRRVLDWRKRRRRRREAAAAR
jgi:hypothetical protein